MHPTPILSNEISKWLRALVGRHADIREVWLIGSRANGTSRPDSDWDFLVMGGPALRPALSADTQLHREDIDLLVVDDQTRDFSAAWGREKSGSLDRWEWALKNGDSATYKATKWIASSDDDKIPIPGANLGQQHVSRARALRVWP